MNRAAPAAAPCRLEVPWTAPRREFQRRRASRNTSSPRIDDGGASHRRASPVRHLMRHHLPQIGPDRDPPAAPGVIVRGRSKPSHTPRPVLRHAENHRQCCHSSAVFRRRNSLRNWLSPRWPCPFDHIGICCDETQPQDRAPLRRSIGSADGMADASSICVMNLARH